MNKNNSNTDLVILRVKDIMSIYNLGRDETYYHLQKKDARFYHEKGMLHTGL